MLITPDLIYELFILINILINQMSRADRVSHQCIYQSLP